MRRFLRVMSVLLVGIIFVACGDIQESSLKDDRSNLKTSMSDAYFSLTTERTEINHDENVPDVYKERIEKMVLGVLNEYEPSENTRNKSIKEWIPQSNSEKVKLLIDPTSVGVQYTPDGYDYPARIHNVKLPVGDLEVDKEGVTTYTFKGSNNYQLKYNLKDVSSVNGKTLSVVDKMKDDDKERYMKNANQCRSLNGATLRLNERIVSDQHKNYSQLSGIVATTLGIKIPTVFVRQKQATVEETFASSLYKFDQPDRVLSYVSFIKTALYTVSNTAMVEFKSTKKSSYYSSNTVFIDCVGKIELLKVEPFVVNLNKLDTRIKISVQSFFDRVLNAVMEPAKLVNDHARDKVRREQKMIDLLEKELDLKEKELELREREIEAREDDC